MIFPAAVFQRKKVLHTTKKALFLFICLFVSLCICVTGLAAGYAKLQRGDYSEDVLRMQTALAAMGYTITADGKYGAATERVVRQFQKDQGLSVDGVAGNMTLTRLYQLVDGTVYATALPTAGQASAEYQKLQTGSSGSEVLKLQTALNTLGFNLKTDGKYGSATAAAVRAFQRANGLPVDGVASANTQRLLYSLAGASTGMQTSQPTLLPTAAPTQQTVTAVPQQSAQTAYQTAQVTTGGGTLNLRQYPSGTVIASIPNGSTLYVLQYGSTWCEVYYGNTHGYVMTSFLSFTSPAVVTTVPTAAPTATPVPYVTAAPNASYAVVTGGALNLRSSASLGASAILSIPNGRTVRVLVWGDTWSQVDYEGYVGYVMTRYLSASGTSAVVTAVPTAVPTVVPAVTAVPTAAAGYDTSLLTRTLRSGYTGADVTYVQQKLASLNYLTADRISGTYDEATITAVKKFQQVHGLTVDGLAGKKTFAMLFSGTAVSYSESVSSYQTLHIYYETVDTSQTSAVKKMQQRLRDLGYAVSVTGQFDETTYMAVVSFQLRNGITVSGAADAATQSRLYSDSAKGPYAPAGMELEEGAGYIQGPAAGEVQLLHWYNTVKPSLSGGATLLIYDPTTHLSWNLRLMSTGRHADCEPVSLRDTLIMFRALGQPSWTVHPVYVRLPDGRWTMATMHDRPHLTGSVQDNGFDGHLCVHFLRDMNEVTANDPNYGVTNQNTLREAWKALTGQTVN